MKVVHAALLVCRRRGGGVARVAAVRGLMCRALSPPLRRRVVAGAIARFCSILSHLTICNRRKFAWLTNSLYSTCACDGRSGKTACNTCVRRGRRRRAAVPPANTLPALAPSAAATGCLLSSTYASAPPLLVLGVDFAYCALFLLISQRALQSFALAGVAFAVSVAWGACGSRWCLSLSCVLVCGCVPTSVMQDSPLNEVEDVASVSPHSLFQRETITVGSAGCLSVGLAGLSDRLQVLDTLRLIVLAIYQSERGSLEQGLISGSVFVCYAPERDVVNVYWCGLSALFAFPSNGDSEMYKFAASAVFTRLLCTQLEKPLMQEDARERVWRLLAANGTSFSLADGLQFDDTQFDVTDRFILVQSTEDLLNVHQQLRAASSLRVAEGRRNRARNADLTRAVIAMTAGRAKCFV